MTDLHLSLISHTNVGKTTLARTLLKRDVGEVRDAPHVTDTVEPFVLRALGEHRLVLWDTPGFGDTARLLRALRAQEQPLRWFFAQVWDRLVERGFWSSQQAARHVQDQADVVLYLVNAAEEPAAAGYVRHELDLLTWIGRPVLLLLNQTGPAAQRDPVGLEEDWRRYVALWPIVADVLALDAFTRCWVEETVLFRRLEPLLPEDKRPAMTALAASWEDEGRRTFEAAMAALAEYLAEAAGERQPLPATRAGRADKKQALEALGRRLETSTRRLLARLLELHGLAGEVPPALERRLADLSVRGAVELTPQKGALIGGVVSGAMGGLAADLLAGGLSFGGGLVAGALLGALGGVGLSRANELVRIGGEPHVTWSPLFLDRLARQALLRYLAVAHFGRGRGELRELEEPATWAEAVDAAVEVRGRELRQLWKLAAKREDGATREIEALLAEATETLLEERYPTAMSAR